MISFQKVTKAYSPSSIALSDVSFEVKQGEFVSLVGKSGAGKTTLLKLLLAEERPTQGNVFFEDQDVARIPSSLLPHLRRKIGTVFQDYKLLHSKTAYENIAYVMEVMGATDAEIERDVAGKRVITLEQGKVVRDEERGKFIL